MDPGMNELLKWSVENSTASTSDPHAAPPTSHINPDALNALFGGPSDADLMLSSMTAITTPDLSLGLSDRLVAFDNFEQLIENLDNANNLGPLALWTPLLGCLESEESEIRKMAAWCVGTAVQNNVKCQEQLLAMGGLPALAKIAVDGEEIEGVRRKAVYALSSACRNYQPAMDVLTAELGKLGREEWAGKVDAGDMDACDGLIGGMRKEAATGKKE